VKTTPAAPALAQAGTELHWEAHGPLDAPGPPVVLLHGLGSSSSDWALQIPLLGERHRVLALDLRGHGRSPRERGRLTVERMAADVRRTLAALGVVQAHVVGLSLGGCVALALALDEPARVRSLTLVNAFARLRPEGPRGLARGAVRIGLVCCAPMRTVAAHVARGLFPAPEQRDLYLAAVDSLSRTRRRVYLDSLMALLAFDVRRHLPAIQPPTLVVAGERDGTVPRSAALRLAREIPGARLHVVPDSGHATPHDQPRAFSRILLEFIDAVG
jgi:3-oxoadipate enol-lactonase